MKCVRCGEDFRVDEARSDYNSYVSTYNNASEFIPFNFHFEYDGDSIAGERICFFCAVNSVEEKVSEAMVAAGIEEFGDEDDEPDVGCAACGNPAYPNRKSSCPMFDD
jgi:ribosomal protein L37E